MEENENYDIAVVGAGAAGLTAAMFAKRAAPDARVIAFDGAPKIGAKILISGGGRCNVTHHAVAADDFNGNQNAIARVLRTFTVEQTIAWLAELGVTLKREETGKLFPTTDRAYTIVDALLRGCEGVEIRTGARVLTCHPERESRDLGGWGAEDEHGAPPARVPRLTLGMTGGTITAKRVILATGGRSVPKTGSDGHGYALARRRGRQRSTIRVTFAGDCQHVPPRVLRLRLCRNMRAATFALLLLAFTLSLAAGEPSPIEDHNFMLEVGRNRDNAVLQYNTFFFRGASALELAQEWAVTSPKKRSEERRVGKECRRLCRSRWSPYH